MNGKLKTAEDVYYTPGNHPPSFHCRRWIEAAFRAQAERDPTVRMLPELPVPDKTVKTPYAVARVDLGRWVADCPSPICWSAQEVSREDRRYFCPGCCNAYVHGAFVNVMWPEDEQEIERLLMARPYEMNRFWHPYDTIELLRKENREHNVGVSPAEHLVSVEHAKSLRNVKGRN